MYQKKHFTDIIFIIMLIGIFAISAVTLTILGVNTYKNFASENGERDATTSLLFFAQKIRQCENKTSIHTEKIGNTDALILESSQNGRNIKTCLFVNDGYLKEITALGNMKLSKEFGQNILPLNNAEFGISDERLLTITVTDTDNRKTSIKLSLQTKRRII